MADKVTAITIRLGPADAERVATEIQRLGGTAAGFVKKALDDYFQAREQASRLTDLRDAILGRLDNIELHLIKEIASLVEDEGERRSQS